MTTEARSGTRGSLVVAVSDAGLSSIQPGARRNTMLYADLHTGD